MKKIALIVCAACVLAVAAPMTAAAEQRSAWPPLPGIALKAGGGWYRSVPCQCVDRRLFNLDVSARLHFGDVGALEVEFQRGIMLLGGNFPTNGWAIGSRISILPQRGRWWDGLSARAGYRHWYVMGMRANGAPGAYGALSWAVPVLPYLNVETDVIAGRTFRAMQHWNLEGRLGLSARF